MGSPDSFERDTTYRLLTEAVRHWMIAHYLASHGKLPGPAKFWFYSEQLDWGDAGPKEPEENRPLRKKRIAVTLTVEDC